MSFPSGAPGGFPGQGPQYPQQGSGPTTGGVKLGMPQILFLVTAGLGLLNLFLGFAAVGLGGGDSAFYEGGVGWVPGLLFMSGLAAALAILPGDNKPRAWPAIFSLGVMLPFLFTVFQSDGDLETGGIMILIFGLVQMLVAIAAFLFDEGIIKPPAPQPSPYGQPQSPYGQQQFGQPQGQFGQPQFGQPGGQDPQSGAFSQPTQFAQPVGQPGQQGQPAQQPTQYAPQQGQFYQQPGEAGQQKPGTPPGGFGQPGQPGQQGQPGQPS